MATHTLDFERPLLELERQIEELKRAAGDTVDVTKELGPLEGIRSAISRKFFRVAGASSYNVPTGTPPDAPRRWASA